MFSCEICEIFKNTCFEEHLRLTASEQLPLNSDTITNFDFTLFILFIIGKLVNTFSPGTMPEQTSDNDVENCRLAMDVAQQRCGIEKIISPDEMANPNIPELAIMAYTVQFTKVKQKQLSRCVFRKSYSGNSKKISATKNTYCKFADLKPADKQYLHSVEDNCLGVSENSLITFSEEQL